MSGLDIVLDHQFLKNLTVPFANSLPLLNTNGFNGDRNILHPRGKGCHYRLQ